MGRILKEGPASTIVKVAATGVVLFAGCAALGGGGPIPDWDGKGSPDEFAQVKKEFWGGLGKQPELMWKSVQRIPGAVRGQTWDDGMMDFSREGAPPPVMPVEKLFGSVGRITLPQSELPPQTVTSTPDVSSICPADIQVDIGSLLVADLNRNNQLDSGEKFPNQQTGLHTTGDSPIEYNGQIYCPTNASVNGGIRVFMLNTGR